MRNPNVRYFLICSALALVGVAGCGPAVSTQKAPTESPATHSKTEATLRKPPIDVQIAQSFRDQAGNLVVKVKLTAKTTLPTEKLDVTIKGLADGEIVAEQQVQIKDVLGRKKIRAGESALVHFEMKDVNLTEYQVASRWGDEALKSTPNDKASASGTQSPARARLDDDYDNSTLMQLLPILSRKAIEKSELACESPPCDQLLTAVIDLANRNTKTLDSLQIALELVWLNDGDTPRPRSADEPLTADEQLITLESLAIEPKRAKTVRIKVDRPIPTLPGGRFEPVVRLLGSSVKYSS